MESKDARSTTAPDIGHGPWEWAYECTATRPWDRPHCARPSSKNAAHQQRAAETRTPAAPHLPDELWHRIASHLTTKEWARASSTCRQLRWVQQEHLNIEATSADGSISAMLWLAKQLPGVRSIILDGWPVRSGLQEEEIDKIQSTMKAALDVPQSLSKLTHLSVRLGPSNFEKAEEMIDIGVYPHLGECLASTLAQAFKLSKLELACRSIYALPSLANLKHLALCLLRFPMSEDISTFLHKMPLLETLQLSHPPGNHKCPGSMADALLFVPASVQRVELINVYPEFLVLHNDTAILRLVGAMCWLPKALAHWADVRSQLRGLRLNHDACKDLPIHPWHVSHLWGYVEVLQFMRGPLKADMNLHWLPRASLGNLTSLHVKMIDLCITVPALPGLKDLRLYCSGTLCLSFQDALVSAENLAGIEWVYADICADDTLIPFWAALSASGKGTVWQRWEVARAL